MLMTHILETTLASENMARLSHEGSIISTIVLIFLVKTGIFACFEGKILAYLETKDNCKSETMPRMLGMLYHGFDELAFISGAVMSWVFGSVLLGVIHSVIAIACGAWLVEVFTTKLRYQSGKVTFRSVTTLIEFGFEDIRDVQWGTELRVYGPVLKVRLNSGKTISLPKLYYLGLDNFLEAWKKQSTANDSA